MKRKQEAIFIQNLNDFKKSLCWLEKSLEKVRNTDINDFQDLSEEDLEKIEVLFSRFSRAVDMLINRILRGIDILELEDVGTKLDIVIRAEKRGFVDSYETLIAMKDLRNELSHEYVGERLISKLDEVRKFSEKLIEVGNRVIEYGERELLPKLRR